MPFQSLAAEMLYGRGWLRGLAGALMAILLALPIVSAQDPSIEEAFTDPEALAQDPSIEESFTDPEAVEQPADEPTDPPAEDPSQEPAAPARDDDQPPTIPPRPERFDVPFPDRRPGDNIEAIPTPEADESDEAAPQMVDPALPDDEYADIPLHFEEASCEYQPSCEAEADCAREPACEADATCGLDECVDCVDGACDDCCSGRPVSWISGPYLRAGYSMVMGDDLLEENSEVGYAISGGYRQPLGPDFHQGRMFFDAGGSYLSAFGETTRLTPGRQETLGGVVSVESDAFSSRLTEVRRSSAHAAIGWYWGDAIDDVQLDPQLRFATRLGGRVGNARGHFRETRLKDPPIGGSMTPTHASTDTFGGLYFGTEVIMLYRETDLGHLELTIDAEFANDFVDFEGFHDGSLGTAAVTFGFMLAR